MRAVIMAGGFGTRLRPLTANVPKPMVPMLNKPMMEHIVDLLKAHGIKDITASLFYQPEAISDYFRTGEKFGINISYVRAEDDYGTAGSVRNAANVIGFLEERILIISGDVLTDVNISEVLQFHKERKADATIVLTRVANPLQFGVVITDEDARINRFLEKPSWGEVFSDTINTGIYVIEPKVLKMIPFQEEYDFSKDLFPLMLEKRMNLYGYISKEYWRDVGNLNEYQEAHLDILAGKVGIDIKGEKYGTAVTGEQTVIKTSHENLHEKVFIGNNCLIEEDVKIFNSVIGDKCVIKNGAVIRNSVVWSNTHVGSNTDLSSDVIGFNCKIGNDVTIGDNVIISDRCSIGDRARLISNIKLWPNKQVEEAAVLNRSLVLEDRWSKNLFTDARVSGLSNIDMNPEFGARLGAALGTFLGEGNIVATSRDSDNVSRMINRSIICGLLSAGVNVNDLRAMPIPLVRHELSSGAEAGGVHVRRSPYNKDLTDIIFFDSNARDLPINKTKSVERIFFGEDFFRAKPIKVGNIFFTERAPEIYRKKFFSTLNLDIIRKAKFKIVLDYSNGVASTIFPSLLGEFNSQTVALNAHLDHRKLTRDEAEIDESLNQLSHVVTSLGYDLGCMIDPGGERIIIVDENGKVIENDRLLSLVVKLYIDNYSDIQSIAVPVSASAEIDVIAKKYNIIKTRTSHLAMMEAASNPAVSFVGGTKGGFIFTEFFFASDAMFSLAKILELLVGSGKLFGELNESVIKFYRVKHDVQCEWDKKGKVMRYIMKETEKSDRELIDGVKINFSDTDSENICVLLIPDRERPIFHVTAETKSESSAIRLAEEYVNKVIEWRDN